MIYLHGTLRGVDEYSRQHVRHSAECTACGMHDVARAQPQVNAWKPQHCVGAGQPHLYAADGQLSLLCRGREVSALCGGHVLQGCCLRSVQATGSLRPVWGPSIAGTLPRLCAEAGQTGSWPPSGSLHVASGKRPSCRGEPLVSALLPDWAAAAASCGRPRT